MALLDVVHYGDPILRKECKSVTNYKILPDIIEDMFEEPGKMNNCPNDPYTISDAAHVYKQLRAKLL